MWADLLIEGEMYSTRDNASKLIILLILISQYKQTFIGSALITLMNTF